VERSFETTELVTSLCQKHGKKAVIYISMAFGNPYGDPWNIGLLTEWVEELFQAGARIIPLSNVSTEIDARLIHEVYSTLIPMFPDIEFGLHLHTANQGWYPKVDAAYRAGCRRFDGVINGWGGCPIAGKELLGNLKTEYILEYMVKNEIPVSADPEVLKNAYRLARELFDEA
jgi:hydroxymethylglutaryl-CoA lyase